MGRERRPRGEWLTYHVTSRGNDGQPIFENDLDRRFFLSLVERTRERRRWRIHAWCLMTNHVHLLLTTEQPTISDGVRDILGPYARRFNYFHGRTGHLFGRRFHTVLVTSDEQFFTTVRYVNRNPVRAGIIDRPDRYPWSGYGVRRDLRPPVTVEDGDLLRRLHPVASVAERQLRELVEAPASPAKAGHEPPGIGLLMQAIGVDGGARAAIRLGHSQRDVAAVIGLTESGLHRRLNPRRRR